MLPLRLRVHTLTTGGCGSKQQSPILRYYLSISPRENEEGNANLYLDSWSLCPESKPIPTEYEAGALTI
jgi:hypothetical protein